MQNSYRTTISALQHGLINSCMGGFRKYSDISTVFWKSVRYLAFTCNYTYKKSNGKNGKIPTKMTVEDDQNSSGPAPGSNGCLIEWES